MDYLDDEETERATLYKLFASLFMQEPTEETVLTFKSLFQMEFDDTTAEIGNDFRELFPEETGHCQPYESLYTYPLGDRPKLWGKAAGEVQEVYRSTDLMIDEEIDLPPDHLSVELLFMSYLIERGLADKQKDFIENHLLTWVPVYCDEVRNHARTTFYREAADLFKGFLSSDHEGFGGE